jgi:hypothetical protein
MRDGAPHVDPVWVDLEGDLILVCTGEGALKAKNTRRDARVGLSIVAMNNPYREAALTLFTRIVDELQAVLSVERWIGTSKESRTPSIQRYVYEDRNSSAHIDIDIIGAMGLGGQDSYMVSTFAWSH